jgi:hypothetical protein
MVPLPHFAGGVYSTESVFVCCACRASVLASLREP